MTFDHRRPGLSQQLWLLGFNLWVWQRGAPFFVGSEDRSGRLDPWNPGSLEPAVGLQSLLSFHAGLTFWINILQVWSRDHASTRIASPRVWFSYLPAMLTQFWLEIASQLHHGDNAGKQLGRTRSVPVILFAPEPCFCWWNLQVFYFPWHFCLVSLVSVRRKIFIGNGMVDNSTVPNCPMPNCASRNRSPTSFLMNPEQQRDLAWWLWTPWVSWAKCWGYDGQILATKNH